MIQLENALARYKDIILDRLAEKKVKCWLAGGAIRDYFMGVPINTDYDIFFPDEVNFKKAKKFFKKKGSIKWESDNGLKVEYEGRTYDLIKIYFNDPQSTIDNFDFTVSMFAVSAQGIYHGPTSFIDLAKRQLMINKITYPASTLSRAFRYSKKGFSLCNDELKKIIEAIQDMPKEIEDSESSVEDSPPSGDSGEFFRGID